MAPLLAEDGSTLANGQLEEYLQKNLDSAKVGSMLSSVMDQGRGEFANIDYSMNLS